MNQIWRVILIGVFTALFVAIVVVVLFYFAILQPHVGVAVPGLSGLSPEQAQIILKPKGLMLKLAGEEPSEVTPSGTILRQEPEPGVIVVKGGMVSVWVSKGAERLVVPELTGLNLYEALTKLEALGLKVERVDSGFSDSLPRGIVTATKPQAGSPVKKGDGVIVAISKGQEMVVVPELIGKRLEAAKTILGQFGLVVGKISYRVSTEYSPGRVIGQKPAAGTSLTKGDTVNLVVATVLE